MDTRNPFHKVDPKSIAICQDGSIRYGDKELDERTRERLVPAMHTITPNAACSNILSCVLSQNNGRCHNVSNCDLSANYTCPNYVDCENVVNKTDCSDFGNCNQDASCPKP